MNITLEVDGGIVPVRYRYSLNSLVLPFDQKTTIEGLVRSLNAPAMTPPPPGSADQKNYTLTINFEIGQQRYSFSSSVSNPTLRDILSFMTQHGKKERVDLV